jgi:hypothetical protein
MLGGVRISYWHTRLHFMEKGCIERARYASNRIKA